MHPLGTSLATHLVEKGTIIRYIEDLLGHASLNTTMLYIHIVPQDAGAIQSPLDRLKYNSKK